MTKTNKLSVINILLFILMIVSSKIYSQDDQKNTNDLPVYYTAFEAGLKKGSGDLKEGRFKNSGIYASLDIVFPIKVYENLYLGPGIGIDTYEHGAYMPVFLDLRYHMGKGKVLPFVFSDLGYAFGWMKNDEGSEWAGHMINPGFGIAYREGNKPLYYLKFSYKLQRTKTPTIGVESYVVDAEFFEIKFAFVF